MAEAWKESLKRIKRGEERERELRREEDPQTLYNVAAWIGTDVWIQMADFAEALEALGDHRGAHEVLEVRRYLFVKCGSPYRHAATQAYLEEKEDA